MCGPLALLVPVTGPTTSQRITSRLTYNLGRLFTYAILGALFGTFGKTLALIGLQRWLSIIAGTIILIALAFSIFDFRFRKFSIFYFPFSIKAKFSNLLRKRTLISIASLGALNGLLPCGLVYIAATAAAATANPINGAVYMLIFGAGTIPMLLAIAFGGTSLNLNPIKVRRLIPTVAAVAGVLLIVRGLALGIPYLSPSITGHCPACLHAQL
jgi:sulfite exporter TauE/SafE